MKNGKKKNWTKLGHQISNRFGLNDNNNNNNIATEKIGFILISSSSLLLFISVNVSNNNNKSSPLFKWNEEAVVPFYCY